MSVEELLEDVRLDLEHVVGAPVTGSLVLPGRDLVEWLSALLEVEGGGAPRRSFEIGVPLDRPLALSRPRYVELLSEAVAPVADLRRAYAAFDRCVEESLVDPSTLGGVLGVGVSALASGRWANALVTATTTTFLDDLLTGAPLEWALRRSVTEPVAP